MSVLTKEQAEKHGAEFLARARDEGFNELQLKVWDDLGWHYILEGYLISFYPGGVGSESFQVIVGAEDGGFLEWSPKGYFSSFREAFKEVMRRCEFHVGKAAKIMAHLSENRPDENICCPERVELMHRDIGWQAGQTISIDISMRTI